MKIIVLCIILLFSTSLYTQNLAESSLKDAKERIDRADFGEAMINLDYIIRKYPTFYNTNKEEIDSLYDLCLPLSVTTNNISFAWEGGKQQISVRSHSNWAVIDCPDWITCIKQNGLQVECITNNSTHPRTGMIVLQTIDRKQTVLVNTMQKAASPFLQVEGGPFTLDSTIVVTVNANINWIASTFERWFNVQKQGNDSLVIIPYNYLNVQRQGEIILHADEGNISRTIRVQQGCSNAKATITNLSYQVLEDKAYIDCSINCQNLKEDTLVLRMCGFWGAVEDEQIYNDTIVPDLINYTKQVQWTYRFTNDVPNIHTIDVALFDTTQTNVLDSKYLHFIGFKDDYDEVPQNKFCRLTDDYWHVPIYLSNFKLEDNVRMNDVLGINLELFLNVSKYNKKQFGWEALQWNLIDWTHRKNVPIKHNDTIININQFIPYSYGTDTIDLDSKAIKIEIHNNKYNSKEYILWMNPIIQCPQKQGDYNKFLERGIKYYLERDYSKAIKNLFMAAKYGNNPQAQHLLYKLYVHHDNIKRPMADIYRDKCSQWLFLSADGGWGEAQLFLGKYYYENNYYNQSFRFLSSIDTLNDKDALYYLGNLYEWGINDIQQPNPRLAFEYMTRADSCGNIQATYTLGRYYRDGFGCAKDVERSYLYMSIVEKTSVTNSRFYASALYELGRAELYGKGCKKDVQKAILHLQKSTNFSFFDKPNAQMELGKAYLQVRNDDLAVPLFDTIITDYSFLGKDMNWIGESLPDVFRLLGDCYITGRGVKTDTIKALSLYQQGANINNASALERLGECAQFGIGMNKDRSLADSCYLAAMKEGNELASYEYSLIHNKDSVLTNYNSSILQFIPEVYLYNGEHLEKNLEFDAAYDTYVTGISMIETWEGDFAFSSIPIIKQSYCVVVAALYERIGDLYANGLGSINLNHHMAKQYYEKALLYFESTKVHDKINNL